MQVDMNLLASALQAIIPVSAALRVILCLVRINTDPDQAGMYKTRIKNTVLFTVVAEIALSFLYLIKYYLQAGGTP